MRVRQFTRTLLVFAVFASVVAVAAADAPRAEAQAHVCTKTLDAAGVQLDVVGLAAGDRIAVRRDGKWVASIDPDALPGIWPGAVDDVWTVRLRGDAFAEPYEEVACVSAADNGGTASCGVVNDAASLRLEFDGFAVADRISVRRNGSWYTTTDGSVPSINIAGAPADAWSVRARGAEFEDPYTTIECESNVVEPPPPDGAFCVESDGSLTWNDGGVDTYQIRRAGRWVASTSQRSYPTGELAGEWLVRYRVGQTVINEPCVIDDGGDPGNPDEPTCSSIVDPEDREQVIISWDLGPEAADTVVVRTTTGAVGDRWRAELTGASTWSGSGFIDGSNFLRVRIGGEQTDVQCPFPNGTAFPDPLDTPIGSCSATADGPNRGDRVVVEWATADDVTVDGTSLRSGYAQNRSRFSGEVAPEGSFETTLGEVQYVIRFNYRVRQVDIPCEGIEDLVFVESHPALQIAELSPTALEVSPGTYLFSENFDFLGPEIWFGDGTRDGSELLLGDFTPGAEGTSSPVATNGSTHYFMSRRAMYVTDGTPEGTRYVTSKFAQDPFVMSNGSLLARDSSTRELLVINTNDDSVTVVDITPGIFQSRPEDFHDLGDGSAVFVAAESVYRTDLTEPGTVPIAPGVSNVEALVEYGDQYFFAGETAASGRELWVTNGTAAGTQMLIELEPGINGAAISQLTVGPDGFWFFAETAANGVGVWFSDGTTAGTTRVADVQVTDIEPQAYAVVGGRLIYSEYDGARFDLISAGTTQGSSTTVFDSTETTTAVRGGIDGDRYVFFVVPPDGPTQIWKTDGTIAGTDFLFSPGFGLSASPFNGRFYLRDSDDQGFLKNYYEFAD